MKILFLTRLYWPHGGGVETHVAGLARELIRLGHRVWVVTEQYDEKLKLEEYIDGVKVIRIPYSAIRSKKRVWQWVLGKKELWWSADIIHIHDVFWWYLPMRIFYPRYKVFITFHGYEPGITPGVKNRWLKMTASRLSEGSICVGDFIRKWYGVRPNIVTYGAAEVKPMKTRPNRAAVFVGRLEADTGIFAYLRAMLDIRKGISSDIYGKGKDTAEVERIVRRNKLPVAIHGWTNNPRKVMSTARYVFTSQYLTILEAMQAKRLVVAVYDNPLKKDYLYMHPMSRNMIIASDGKDLARKFNSITDMYEKAYIDEAYEWAKQQTWDKLTKQYLTLWKI